MNLSKEIIIGLGFEETKVNEFDMYKYSAIGLDPIYLEKPSNEKEFYMIYKKDDNDNMKECGHCENLESLFLMMMKINHRDSLQMGKEYKQQEIKSVLGL